MYMNTSTLKNPTTSPSLFPAFFEGMGRILDFGQAFTFQEHPSFEPPEHLDTLALKSDWEAVGNDIQVAIDTYATRILPPHRTRVSGATRP